MSMTFGIHVGHLGGPLDEMRRLWKFADDHTVSTGSRFRTTSRSPHRMGGDLDCFEALSSMTAAAVETRRVRIGCLVFCIHYRNPGLLAKALSTIDHLSAGRVECGIGAGWHEREYRAFGIPFAPIGVREDQLEEYAQILRLLFDQKASDFAGKHFQLSDARCNPKPLQKRLRIWIGGIGEKRTLPRRRALCGWLERALSRSSSVAGQEHGTGRMVSKGRAQPGVHPAQRERRLLYGRGHQRHRPAGRDPKGPLGRSA